MNIEGPYIFYTTEGIAVTSYSDLKKKPKVNATNIENSAIEYYKANVDAHQHGSFTVKIATDFAIPDFTYPSPEKTFVISDLEGDFEYLRHMLITAGVMNESYQWTYGNGHVVSLGDMFDRGPLVNECLWLLYHLENQAKSHGGLVHVILGNHEVMAMTGDNRYIHRKYRRLTEKLGLEYSDWYSDDTVLGRWLRSKNSIEIIGKTLYVHGGMSADMSNSSLSLTGINNIVRDNLQKSSKQSMTSSERLVMGRKGPLWYRGYVDKKIRSTEVQRIVEKYDINEIIIGHTVVNEIKTFFDKKIYAIDVERKKTTDYQALIIENSNFFKINSIGEKLKI